MAKPTVRLVGGDRLQATLASTRRDLADMTPENAQAADTVVTRARMRAPRRSGRLASSIRGHGEPDAAVVEVGVRYGAVQEFGWPARNIPAQPYLVDSVEETQGEWTATYQDGLQGRLDHVKGA